MPGPNFNSIARPYRYLEYLTLGRALETCRSHYLPHLLTRRQALILGDGDGRFLANLLAANPEIKATAIDTSGTMLQLLAQRCSPFANRLTTHNESALIHTADPQTDLITAHFFFDCLSQSELNTLITNLKNTSPQTLWLISDFRIPPGVMRLPARLFIRSLYFAFRLLTGLRTTSLPDHETPLRKVGLIRTHQHLSLFGLLTTELWQ